MLQLRHFICVRAIGENSTCSNIEVGRQVSINGAPIINTTNVVMDGLRIR